MTPGIVLVMIYVLVNALFGTYQIDKRRAPLTVSDVVVYLVVWTGLVLALVYWK